MSLPMRMLIAAMALAASMGGCDRGWQEFQRVELGKPVPADSILRPQKAKDPNAVPTTAPSSDGPKRVLLVWSDWGPWPVPMSLGWHAVGVKADSEGRVIAKSYRAELWSSYGLVVVPVMRLVMELQVPSSVPLEPGNHEEAVSIVGTATRRTLRSYIINALHEMDQGPESGEQSHPSQFLVWLSGVNYMTGMSAYGGVDGLKRSIGNLPLKGITRQGYDRTFSPVCGGSIRLQNLGQGRIRVEMNFLRLYDPMGLAGYLYYVK